jgi:putative transposase
MRKAFKYRIYLTNGQRRILEHQLEECRWVYNQTRAARQEAYEQGNPLGWYDTKAMLPGWKVERPALKHVHSQVLQNVTQRVDLAFQAFFRRKQAGAEAAGYPRLKSFKRYDSITYPQYGNGVDIRGGELLAYKLGRVHVVWHRPVAGTIKTVTFSRSRTGKWYVSFSCDDVVPKVLPESPHMGGVDMGLASFATVSSGLDDVETIENPRFYRRDEADLKRVQKLKDAAKNAQNWDENRRRKKALAHIHERIRNRRESFAHQKAREMVDLFQLIVFEELEPLKMGANKGRGMRKSVQDVAWSQFIHHTRAKAEEAGRTVVLVNPRNTSKMCSRCGELVEKKLSDRVHACPHCGLTIGRDHNAAINILHRGIEQLLQ